MKKELKIETFERSIQIKSEKINPERKKKHGLNESAQIITDFKPGSDFVVIHGDHTRVVKGEPVDNIDSSFIAQSNKEYKNRIKMDKEGDFGRIIILEKKIEYIKNFIANHKVEYEVEKAKKELAKTIKEHDKLLEEAQVKYDKN